MNLLEQFSLRHLQLSHLHVELREVIERDQAVQSHVELNLTPREMQQPPDGGVTYQITARLTCLGSKPGGSAEEALFNIQLVMHAAYQQFRGEPVDFAHFSRHHTTLARQLYPMIQQQLRPLLLQLGLEQITLPLDVVDLAAVPESRSTSVH